MILFNNICNINMLNQFVSTWWCYVFDRNAENHLLTVLQLAPRIIAIVFFWLYIYTYLSNIASLAEQKYHYGRYCKGWKGHCTQVVNPHHYLYTMCQKYNTYNYTLLFQEICYHQRSWMVFKIPRHYTRLGM